MNLKITLGLVGVAAIVGIFALVNPFQDEEEKVPRSPWFYQVNMDDIEFIGVSFDEKSVRFDKTPEGTWTFDDPEGILPPLPAVVAIPAGEADVRVELPLQDATGTARLTLVAGDAAIEVYVVSRSQSWSALPVIRIPVGAVAVVPFRLRWPERAGRDAACKLGTSTTTANPRR